jgi:hypothetical protein
MTRTVISPNDGAAVSLPRAERGKTSAEEKQHEGKALQSSPVDGVEGNEGSNSQ